ncbi:two-component system, response regulator YesN [Paenibacillus algorifonticola]|uniref:Two-component system, response regulator YesN n=1 Tax=Paenibacillus algorifonticola TaxID=684063 RepID=A0A1I2I7Q0_9BACL|nr:response regulator [Paenibacillus algorifonticola]SFF37673.1 two-component system, response regulator YesN [Paenibacillus algorifonticola]
MYQLLIVDDERSVVEGVAATLLEYEMADVEIHKAFSASDALAIMRKYPIDLMITDIRMPGFSGIELMERVRKTSGSTAIILLTGYAEFEYAKQALLSGASDYLLKPVNDEDLISAVKKAFQAVQKEWEAAVSRDNTQRALRENLPLLQRDLLIDLLQNRSITPAALENRLQKLSLPFSPEHSVSLLLIRLEEPFIQYEYNDRALLEYAVCNIAQEVLRDFYQIWMCKDSRDYLAVVVQALDGKDSMTGGMAEQELGRRCLHIQQQVQRYLNGAVSIVISAWGRFPNHLSSSYHHALTAYLKHIGSGRGLLLPLGEQRVMAPVRTFKHLYEPPLLPDLLESGRWDSFMEKLNLIFDELENDFDGSAEHSLEVYCAVTGTLSFIAHKSGYGLFDFFELGEPHMMAFESLGQQRLLRDKLVRLAEKIRGELENEAMDSHSRLIKKVQRFIEDHLAHTISLTMIAEHVFLHPVYLSQIYKAVTDESLSEYMQRIRMEKSAYWLRNSKLKIYEIGSKVGYQNAPYFIKVFKKVYGMTPQEYRELHSV